MISDEIYRRISYDAPAPSLLDLATRARPARDRGRRREGVRDDGLADRLGDRAARARRGDDRPSSRTPRRTPRAVSQHAALAALSDRAPPSRRSRRWSRSSARGAMRWWPSSRRSRALGYVPIRPARSTCTCASRRRARRGIPAATSPQALLEKHDVAIVPGSAFLTPGWVRLSYAAPREQVLTGVRRLIALWRERRG